MLTPANDLHVVEPCGGIEPDIPGLHLLAHDLAVHLALCGYINHCIIEQGGVAAEAAAGFQGPFAFFKFLFRRGERRQVIDVGFDLVLGKGPGHTADLTAAAETAAAADRVNIDTETAGSVQQGSTAGKEPAAA